MTSPAIFRLTVKRQRFVMEYLIDGNATRAAIRAGYSPKTAEQIGYQLLQHSDIAGSIADQKHDQLERIQITADAVLQELARIGLRDPAPAYDAQGHYLNIHQIPAQLRHAIDSFETVEKEPSHPGRAARSTVRHLRWYDKVRALDLLGRHLGLFTSIHKVSLSTEDAEGLKQLQDLVAAHIRGARGRHGSREVTDAGAGTPSPGTDLDAPTDDGSVTLPR